MDLQYCDLCGAVIEAKSLHDSNVNQGVICKNCREGGTLQSSGTAAASGEGHDPSLSGLLEGKNMDLFSAETIAQRKGKAMDRSQTRIKLVEGEGEGSRARPKTQGTGDTASQVGLRRQTPGSTVTTRTPPREGSGRTLTLTLRGHDSPSGSHPAQGSTARWRIQCVHCDTKLSIKPLARASRMSCPKCQRGLLVDTEGRAHPLQADGGSSAPAHMGSVAIAKDTSSWVFAPDSPAEAVSQTAKLLRPGGGSAAVPRAAAPKIYQPPQPMAPFAAPPRQEPRVAAPVRNPDLTDNLSSLLGSHSTTTAATAARNYASPARRTYTRFRAEHVIFTVLIAALPALVGVTLMSFTEMEMPAQYTAFMDIIADRVEQSLTVIRSWLGR